MKGAIIGDIVGSRFERDNYKAKDFDFFSPECRYTDDTVLTLAIAEALLSGNSYETSVKKMGRRYPLAGYGGTFKKWLAGLIKGPYNSWGNGSAMRVSPVAYAFDHLDRVLAEAQRTAEITHNHPEGIKGAQALAGAIFLARQGEGKSAIKKWIIEVFAYDLERTIAQIRPNYSFDVSCQGSVPEAIIAFLESDGFEDAIRLAVSIGGDSDTIACMAGALAEAFHGGVPSAIWANASSYLPETFVELVVRFETQFAV